MPVSKNIIISKMKDLLNKDLTIPDPAGVPTVNNNTGEVTIPTVTKKEHELMYTGDLAKVLDALVDAIVIKIKEEGLEMGESTATKLEVQ